MEPMTRLNRQSVARLIKGHPELKEALGPAKRSKYRNVPTLVDGIRFASKKEARRYLELKDLLQMGVISDLRRQVPYRLDVDGIHICTYRADFVYIDEHGEEVVEDAKGMLTGVYKIKRQLMRALNGIAIVEV